MANEIIGLPMLVRLLGGILIGFPIAFTMIFPASPSATGALASWYSIC